MLKDFYNRHKYEQKPEWDRIALSYLPGQILDVGCGAGRFISQAPKRITGIDQNKVSVEYCWRKGYNVIQGVATSLPYFDSTFDSVHCSHLIEHLVPADAYRLLTEMDRILKPGGVMCIRTPLLHSKFYEDFTHIKPYYPKAIIKYFSKQTADRTLPVIAHYEIIKLKYRKELLFTRKPLKYLAKLFRLMVKKTGYMLIMKKGV